MMKSTGLRESPGHQHSVNDMTRGPIFRKLLSLALPMMGAQLVHMLYNMTDMFWLGRLGSAQVAASGGVGLYMWLSVSFMQFGSIGAGIGVSQSLGAGNREKARTYAQAALTVSILLGALYALVMIIFNRQMIGFFALDDPAVVSDAELYLVIVALGIPATYVTSTVSSIFAAAGNTRIPLVCNLVGMSLNMLLDPLLIFTANLGISGAAFATVIGQLIVCAALTAAVKLHRGRPFPILRFFVLPRAADIARLIKWAAPISIEGFLFTFLAMVTSRRVAFFGTGALAVSRVGSQIESITWLLGGAFGSALITFTGQNFGAGRWDRIRSTFRLATLALLSYGAFASFIMLVPGRHLFALFLPDPALTENSIAYLTVFAAAQIPMCMEGVSSNMFRGLGRTLPPAIVNTACNVLRVPFAWLLSMTPLGLTGVWVGITASALLKGCWSYVWYVIGQRKQPI